MKLQVVWFKRDLRVEDNEVLSKAASVGPVLPLYILEPNLWQQPDMSHRHYMFLSECISSLNSSLTALGQPLYIQVGEAVSVLNEIDKNFGIDSLWSHQETWNDWTYKRDKKVILWAKSKNISWHQPRQLGVIRGLKNRDGWAGKWGFDMKKTLIVTPQKLPFITSIETKLPNPEDIGLKDDSCTMRQVGGRSRGLAELNSFLYERGEHYTKEMSSPVTAFSSCSRISPYLAFGVISMREVFQIAEKRVAEIKLLPRGTKGKWPNALRSFTGRLRWHCHFIQKLEDEPRMEFSNLHSAYNGLRESSFNEDYFKAWQDGMTGYPMVDASMRALNATGWINFRMRAMLVSFASYHLWLHWTRTAHFLATKFTDYEPGIHYSQFQMQSGTTGINSIRIYNPIKQGVDNDPNGVFIREWIPELRDVPDEFIHTPWLYTASPLNYPAPIVDEKLARQEAAAKIYSVRKKISHKVEAGKIAKKHGSRKSGLKNTVDRPEKKKNSQQGELPL
ncbi:MAG: deoxyribodipyrimidine photo-lyase [Pseudomonadota bacterium]|nr:deoxyribodipyrimidine photo-lyase [Pseudomonadota bacterium]